MYFDAISFYHPNDLYSLFTSLNQQSVNISYVSHACYAYHAHNLLPSEVISLRNLKLVHSSS